MTTILICIEIINAYNVLICVIKFQGSAPNQPSVPLNPQSSENISGATPLNLPNIAAHFEEWVRDGHPQLFDNRQTANM